MTGSALAQSGTPAPIRLRVLGGLAGLPQYVQLEEPFWTNRIPEVTGGRVLADIAPSDRSGIRAQDALRTIRLGVTPFGTVLLGSVAAEVPELSGMELPGVAPDLATLRRVVDATRPWIADLLRERHGTELLAVYTYAAQVVSCVRPFGDLSQLRGRRIRTSAPAQSEVVSAIGGIPVVIPFAEVVPAVRAGVVDCAVTGAMGGWQTGLAELSSHIHPMAITWGLALFGANVNAWRSLPVDVRDTLRQEIEGLEARVWQAADAEMVQGLACTAGAPTCPPELQVTPDGRRRPRGRVTLLAPTAADEALRRRVVEDVVLPRWAERCGAECAATWHDRIGRDLGYRAPGGG
ncbi:TRAP transporter substrate-binding protein [Roseomonas sp. CCTCC AB2023176]|uniref:TRAP transporter substrate-binding protein n=1 Tax=Roseomonas sp. CCTCC AB2023176 TaxID=3342640 RepID=UPI0035D7D112